MADEIKEIVKEPELPTASWMWLKNSKGLPSTSVTFVTVAFWVTTLSYIASIFQKIGPFEFRSFDSAACVAFLMPILMNYFGSKWIDSNKK